MSTKPIVVATIGDSAKKFTGFGVVMAQLNMGFHEAGMEVHAIGLLDHDDNTGQLPYNFYPVAKMDDLAHHNLGMYLRKIRPDIIFILSDPGNVFVYLWDMLKKDTSKQIRDGLEYFPPVVAYVPIEGSPIPVDHLRGFQLIKKFNGALVTYCESARRLVERSYPDYGPIHVVNHGSDHANFRRYDDDDRRVLRELVGLDNKFVIGSIGVNKRTKGFPTLIYAARWLKEWGEDDGVVFYLHTNPDDATMYGHPLRQLVNIYDVGDMFLWKQKKSPLDYWVGIERDAGTLEQARELAGRVPETPEGRGFLFAQYDFESMLNLLDLYVDASQNEGWGLPAFEAMKSGIPTISVHDYNVRDEVYADGCYWVDPFDPDDWETWHTGQRLVTVSPKKVAEAIVKMKNDPALREEYAARGQVVASRYSWETSKRQMTQIVKETYEHDQACINEIIEESGEWNE